MHRPVHSVRSVRSVRFARSACVAAATMMAACSGGTSSTPPLAADTTSGADTPGTTEGDSTMSDAAAPDGPTYFQHLKPLVDAYCTRCHVDGGLAPFALTSFEAVAELAETLRWAVEAREMPPFLAAPVTRPLAYDSSLSDDQIAMFEAWIAAGKPKGDPAEPGAPIDLSIPQLSRVDLTIAMPVAYTPTRIPDEYRCFVIPWPLGSARFVTGVHVRPGNLTIAHHAVPYLIDPANAAVVDAADGADGKPGYPCFGGATPPGASSFPTKIISAWTPGELGHDFPAGTGVSVQPGSRIVLQLHYSILADGPQPDRTEVDFSLEESVERNAGNLPWLDLGWPSHPESMLIPAGEANVIYEHVGDPTQAPLLGSFVPGVDASEGLVLHTVLPHLHKLGRRIWLQLERPGQAPERLVDIQRWDFDWQGTYTFAEPITVLPGDQLRIHCEWDNSAQNQPVIDGQQRPPADVTWGEGTYDEMCAASFYVHGVGGGATECAQVSSVAADTGRFTLTFDASPVKDSKDLEGELRGPISGSIYRAEDVLLTGPVDGAQPVATFHYPDVDLRDGPAGPFPVDVDLPAGNYQFLGYMDTDGNAEATGGPDLNDPLLIPIAPVTLACAVQPVTLSFLLLMPNL